FAEIDDLCGRRRCKQGAGQKGSADQASVKHGLLPRSTRTSPWGESLFSSCATRTSVSVNPNDAQYDFLGPPNRERHGGKASRSISWRRFRPHAVSLSPAGSYGRKLHGAVEMKYV